MDLAPIKSTRIYEEIVRQVKAMIAEGRLKSGDRLPPERELAEKFVVSRTSVREALRALESLGLVEIRPGEGTFIREVSIDALVEPLALLMASQREATPARSPPAAPGWPRTPSSTPPSAPPPTTAPSRGSHTRSWTCSRRAARTRSTRRAGPRARTRTTAGCWPPSARATRRPRAGRCSSTSRRSRRSCSAARRAVAEAGLGLDRVDAPPYTSPHHEAFDSTWAAAGSNYPGAAGPARSIRGVAFRRMPRAGRQPVAIESQRSRGHGRTTVAPFLFTPGRD